ncbi:cadherin repeat domain-containing protein [Planctomicrobium piriforme]|uniref:Cadherin domain-containing protein n=1 Tax=Planctomicrobium piriforme TaxID=1576369 RepID=A0A1I3G930_9PLAN|nr:cadherin repeat domain-containing protein [Planctomicrobium piriforme]SFI19980.1 Cadherin domain-containing protein [Planctomicrobium piriforme]
MKRLDWLQQLRKQLFSAFSRPHGRRRHKISTAKVVQRLECRTLLTAAPAGNSVQISQDPSNPRLQFNPDVATDSSGDYIVAWDGYSKTGVRGVIARRFDTDGHAFGGELVVFRAPAAQPFYPEMTVKVAMDAAGDFVAVWTEGTLSESQGIFAQRYNSSGSKQGDVIRIQDGSIPDVAMDAAGDFVLTWKSQSSDGTNTVKMLSARAYDVTGVQHGGDVLLASSTTAAFTTPVVAMNAGGEFAVAWGEGYTTSYDHITTIQSRIYDLDVELLKARDPFVSGAELQMSSIAIDSNGDEIVVWNNDTHQYGSQGEDVYALLYQPGSDQPSNTRVNTTRRGEVQGQVAMDDARDVTVVWTSVRPGPDILGQQFQLTGNAGARQLTPVGKELMVSQERQQQSQPSVAMDPQGDFRVAWLSSYYGNGDGYGHNLSNKDFARRYDSDLTPDNLSVSSTSIAENKPIGTTVGSLHAHDPNSGVTLSYALVAGEGATDNASFQISGAKLLTAASFDFETKSSYSIRIRVTDSYGMAYEQSFVISVTNVNDSPVIGGFSGTAYYSAGGDPLGIARSATVTDDSADFHGGKLTVKLTTNAQGTDVLSIASQGIAAGQISTYNDKVRYAGVVIGTFTGGTNKVGLSVLLNAKATAEAVQALLRSITFSSTLADPTTLPRTVQAMLSDGDGGTSSPVSKTIAFV